MSQYADRIARAFVTGMEVPNISGKTLDGRTRLYETTIDDMEALVSYGPHFPVCVRVWDTETFPGRFVFAVATEDYQPSEDERVAAGWTGPTAYGLSIGVRPTRRPKFSPTTRNHIDEVVSALRGIGYADTGQRVTINERAMTIYAKQNEFTA